MTTVSRTISYRHTAGEHAGHTSVMTLTYNAAQAYTVAVDFGPGEVTWQIWRDILACRVAGRAAWTCSDGYAEGGAALTVAGCWAYLTLAMPDATITVRFIAEYLAEFLSATEGLVPYGTESSTVDADLDALLKDGAR